MKTLIPIFKLLSDETRLRVMVLLFQQPLCVCQICGILNISQPTVSKTLSKLRDMDLVTDERKDKFVLYTLKSNETILSHTLDEITANIELYPQLTKDKERLSERNRYLITCQLEDTVNMPSNKGEPS